VESKEGTIHRVKYWEIIADNLSEAGWSWGCVSIINSQGHQISVVSQKRKEKDLDILCVPSQNRRSARKSEV
jgi:hypothetical protein